MGTAFMDKAVPKDSKMLERASTAVSTHALFPEWATGVCTVAHLALKLQYQMIPDLWIS